MKISDKTLGWLVIIGIALLVYGYDKFNSDDNEVPKQEKESSYTLGGGCVTIAGYVVAISESYLDQATSYAVQKDSEALQKLIDAGVVVILKGGVKVKLVETHISTGKIEIRVEGETTIFWTATEAIEC